MSDNEYASDVNGTTLPQHPPLQCKVLFRVYVVSWYVVTTQKPQTGKRLIPLSLRIVLMGFLVAKKPIICLHNAAHMYGMAAWPTLHEVSQSVTRRGSIILMNIPLVVNPDIDNHI